ncbi:hypothetical protein HK101_006657 [Irineochytrium annulatum]|nr:hypothetical protein HK101_006657 [Irineochytrium annulatum]
MAMAVAIVTGSTGVAVVRLKTGEWSAPCAIILENPGGQIKSEQSSILLFMTEKAVLGLVARTRLILNQTHRFAPGPLVGNPIIDGSIDVYVYVRFNNVFTPAELVSSNMAGWGVREDMDRHSRWHGEDVTWADVLMNKITVDRSSIGNALYLVMNIAAGNSPAVFEMNGRKNFADLEKLPTRKGRDGQGTPGTPGTPTSSYSQQAQNQSPSYHQQVHQQQQQYQQQASQQYPQQMSYSQDQLVQMSQPQLFQQPQQQWQGGQQGMIPGQQQQQWMGMQPGNAMRPSLEQQQGYPYNSGQAYQQGASSSGFGTPTSGVMPLASQYNGFGANTANLAKQQEELVKQQMEWQRQREAAEQQARILEEQSRKLEQQRLELEREQLAIQRGFR